jgi:hypothetical protein
MGYLELAFYDTLLLLVFAFFLIGAIFGPFGLPPILYVTLIFGLVTLPFAKTFSKWWTYLRYNQRVKIAKRLDVDEESIKWIICCDFGARGNTWFFRIYSLVILGISIYHFVRHMIV